MQCEFFWHTINIHQAATVQEYYIKFKSEMTKITLHAKDNNLWSCNLSIIYLLKLLRISSCFWLGLFKNISVSLLQPLCGIILKTYLNCIWMWRMMILNRNQEYMKRFISYMTKFSQENPAGLWSWSKITEENIERILATGHL